MDRGSPTYVYAPHVYIPNMARPSRSGCTRKALETHRAGADRPRTPGPRAAALGPEAARMPGLHSPARAGPGASQKPRPRPRRWAAHFHDNRGDYRAGRVGEPDARRPPRGASGSRLRGAPTATYLARPGPRRPRPAAPSSADRVARPGSAAAAPPLSRQVVGFRPGSKRWSSGSGRQPAARAAARTRQRRRCSRSRGYAAPPRPAPGRACAPPGPPRDPLGILLPGSRETRGRRAVAPAGAWGARTWRDQGTSLRCEPRRVPAVDGSLGDRTRDARRRLRSG